MRRLLPILLLLVAPTAMLATVWHDPWSAGEDDAVYFQPVRALVGEDLAQGRWPLANPYEATGTALMGDPQSAVLYPPTWLFAVTSTRSAYTLSIFLAFALAGIGAFLYLRRLGLVPVAALFGALAFAYGGFFVGHRVHLGMIHTAAFLPWILWCFEGMRRPAGARGAALWLVAVLYLAVTSGHWPALVHVTLIGGVYFLVRARPLGRALSYTVCAGALALAMAAPQLQASFDLIGQATRQRLGYALAGENSFFPPAAVLAFFPFLMGSRTPNVFPQSWWGPGHLCEVLGYVGLVTLVLAAAVVLRLSRKAASPFTPLVRTWTWIAVGAVLFMLGYWLPTYRLVHALPVLGVVRCPARMVLAVDLALATLAAVGVHVIVRRAATEDRLARLTTTMRRLVTVALPVTMLGLLLLLFVTARLLPAAWHERIPWPMEGGTSDVLEALAPTNPAVWVPLALCVLTILAVRRWLKQTDMGPALLVVLLLLDLFVITRFVDVPAAGTPAYDPAASPAAAWLKAQGEPEARVWALTDAYHDRPAERLAPKSAHALHVRTINTYGPFQAPAHAHLFELRLWGVSASWERLVRRNHLLSLYGVRYLTATAARHRAVLESVRTPEAPPPPPGPNLLTAAWRCTRSEQQGGVLRLHASRLWPPSEARQSVRLAPDTRYRLALTCRGPEGGAAHYVRAEIEEDLGGHALGFDANPYALMVQPEQMGEDWRRFTWDLVTPAALPDELTIRLFSLSERPIEVREVSLRPCTPYVPVGVPAGVEPGEPVYACVAVLDPLHPGDDPVRIYENRLCRTPARRGLTAADPVEVERLKWDPAPWLTDATRPLPRLGFVVPAPPTPLLHFVTLPALLLYGLLLVAHRWRRRQTA